MASLALLPVALGTAKARFTPSRFTACGSVGRRKLLNQTSSPRLMFGFPMIAVEDIIPGVCEKGVARRVSRANAVVDDDGTNLDDDDDDAEETLQATIEKSKKVIEMQQDLLKEIVERRKLVSSIKNSIVSTDEQVDSTESRKSSSEYDLPNLEEEVVGLSQSNGASSEDYSGTSTFESKKVQDRDFSGNINVEDSFTGLPSSVTSSGGSSTGNLFETNQWGPLSTLIPKTGKVYTPKKEFVEELATKTNGEGKISADVEGVDAKPPPLAGINVMNIILIAAECAPWSKTGGLGDVAGALPKALARRGHRVMVVTPRYGDYREAQDTGVRKRYMVDGQDMEVIYYQAYVDGVDFVFIDSPMFRHRGSDIYGGNRLDVLKRMVLFCKAAVEVCWHVPCGGVCYGDGNLVYIANDWHSALLPVYLQAYYRDNGLMKYTRSILVIHNIAHQGRGPVDDFNYVDLPAHYKDLFTLYDPVGGEHFNIFAAGLKTADRIVTVSHGYAWEIKTSEGGWGLHSIINESDWKLRGIVNGIDTKEWHPEYDAYLKSDGYANYSLETLDTGKAQCKAALQKELGLPVRPDVPLIGFIGRLDHQKGVDLIADAIPWMMGQDVQLVMLGSGRADLEQMLRQFESQQDDKVRGWVGFSVKTAHRITAGVDILLMPSRFEPCGLNQLYAMMYGTIPVVHAVGGLRDTVKPFDPNNESGYGWTFDRAEANVLIHALGNCLLTFREYKNSWTGLQRRGMSQDLSWDNAAQQYEDVLIAAKYQW